MKNKMTKSKMKKIMMVSVLFSFFVFAMMVSAGHAESADLILVNGRVLTMDAAVPEAEAVAVRSGRVLAVGTNKKINGFRAGSTRVIDVGGKLVIPGFIESHGHFKGLGLARLHLDLTTVANWDGVIRMVEGAVAKAKPGDWIEGRGWHQEKWDRAPVPNVAGLPVHSALSAVSPNNPVLLIHASGHSCFANARAMELAAVDRHTPNPEGGEIVKDKKGNPIGIFRENAMGLIRKALNAHRSKMTPQQLRDEQVKIIGLADRACLENGVTSFHDAGVSFEEVDLYRRLVDEKKLQVRLNVMLGEPNDRLTKRIAKYRLVGYGDHRLTVRGIKRLIDGALGSHGAWLLEPYDSLPDSTGLNTESIEAMKVAARIAMENDFQLCTHAIGDRANREVLNIYEGAFKGHPDKKDLRWRIEHAQHLHPADIPRFAGLGVIAGMQGIHCTSDGPWVPKRLGEKRSASGAYVWRSLLDSGAVICNGTDVPVEDVNPIACFYASVSRKMKNGKLFYPAQRMTRLEALRSYTINGAYAAFEESIKGSLSPGKLADIVVLSRDITTIPEGEIPSVRVLYTILSGRVVYSQ